jgi:hypothetical protein
VPRSVRQASAAASIASIGVTVISVIRISNEWQVLCWCHIARVPGLAAAGRASQISRTQLIWRPLSAVVPACERHAISANKQGHDTALLVNCVRRRCRPETAEI